MRLLSLIALPTLSLMTACGTAPSKLECPALVPYTSAVQSAVLAEKRQAEQAGATWPLWIDDYGRLRAECRALTN